MMILIFQGQSYTRPICKVTVQYDDAGVGENNVTMVVFILSFSDVFGRSAKSSSKLRGKACN